VCVCVCVNVCGPLDEVRARHSSDAVEGQVMSR
jgi:hypothetical protein